MRKHRRPSIRVTLSRRQVFWIAFLLGTAISPKTKPSQRWAEPFVKEITEKFDRASARLDKRRTPPQSRKC